MQNPVSLDPGFHRPIEFLVAWHDMRLRFTIPFAADAEEDGFRESLPACAGGFYSIPRSSRRRPGRPLYRPHQRFAPTAHALALCPAANLKDAESARTNPRVLNTNLWARRLKDLASYLLNRHYFSRQYRDRLRLKPRLS